MSNGAAAGARREMDRATSEGYEPAAARELPARGATVAFIVEKLRADILAGRLAPGTRLVECDLTARFAVSRGPVREALRRLAAEGLIEHLPNRGALVRRHWRRGRSANCFKFGVEMRIVWARPRPRSSSGVCAWVTAARPT